MKADLNLEICVELLRLVTMNTIWFSSMIITPLRSRNGFISEFKMSRSLPHTNSTLSTWLNLRVLITKEWNRCSIQRKKLKVMMDKDMDGIEMVKISVTSRILSKRRVAVFTTHWHSLFNSSMTIVRFTWHIAIHTLTRTAQNSYRDCVSQRAKIG